MAMPTPEQQDQVAAICRRMSRLSDAGELTLDAWLGLLQEADDVSPDCELGALLKYKKREWEPQLSARLSQASDQWRPAKPQTTSEE
jgi:hypothetical protein